MAFRYVVKDEGGRVLAMCSILGSLERTCAALSWERMMWVWEGESVVSKWEKGMKKGDVEKPEVGVCKLGGMRCGECGRKGMVLKNVRGDLRFNWRRWRDVLITVECWLPRCECGNVVLTGEYLTVLDDALEASLVASGEIKAFSRSKALEGVA